MEEQLMKKVFTASTIVCAATMVIMALFIYGRDHLGPLEMMMKQEVQAGSTDTEETSKVYLGIPLPDGIAKEDISVENCYMEQSIVVNVQNASVDFYDGKVLDGSSKHIQSVYYDTDNNTVRIHILLDELCEYSTRFYGQELQLTFIPVHDMYDKVMIVDVGHGGASTGNVSYGISEKDVVLAVAEKLKLLLDQTDIRVYYTRLSDIDVSQEDRMRLAELSGADLYLSLHVNADAGSHVTTGITTYYNDVTEDRGLTGKVLGTEIQKAVIASTKANDEGAADHAGKITLLKSMTGPASMLEIGYLTNRQEALLLASVSYQEKVAEGIYNGIVKVYKKSGKTINQVTENE